MNTHPPTQTRINRYRGVVRHALLCMNTLAVNYDWPGAGFIPIISTKGINQINKEKL